MRLDGIIKKMNIDRKGKRFKDGVLWYYNIKSLGSRGRISKGGEESI